MRKPQRRFVPFLDELASRIAPSTFVPPPDGSTPTNLTTDPTTTVVVSPTDPSATQPTTS